MAASFVVVEENAIPVMLALRLKIEVDHRVVLLKDLFEFP